MNRSVASSVSRIIRILQLVQLLSYCITPHSTNKQPKPVSDSVETVSYDCNLAAQGGDRFEWTCEANGITHLPLIKIEGLCLINT